jgi:hypothetical protein
MNNLKLPFILQYNTHVFPSIEDEIRSKGWIIPHASNKIFFPGLFPAFLYSLAIHAQGHGVRDRACRMLCGSGG